MSSAEVHAQNAYFGDGLRLSSEQKTAKLRHLITVEPVVGERQAIDSYSGMGLLRKTARNVKVPVTESLRNRRWLSQVDYWNSERFDGFDRMRSMTDPSGRLSQAWASGAAREWDRCAVKAALDTAYVDKHGNTPVQLPSRQVVPHNGTGLTLAKVKQAVQMLRRVAPDRDDPVSIWLTGHQESELLNSPTATSADYYAGRPLMDATIPYFMGAYFHVIDDYLDLSQPAVGTTPDGISGTFKTILPLERLEDGETTNVRKVIATVKSGIVMGELMPITTEVNSAKEYGINALQLQVEMSVGGTREHESKVVVIECIDPSSMTFA